MRTLLSAILVAMMLMVPGARGQAPAPPKLPAETAAQKEARLAWWTDARFGMFIHWGSTRWPRATSGSRTTNGSPTTHYQKYFDHFDPDLYNPREWARAAKARRHEVLRHHDQAPRGLLPVGLQVHRLQGDEHAVRQGPAQGRWSRPSAPRDCASGSTTRCSTGTTRTTPSTATTRCATTDEEHEKLTRAATWPSTRTTSRTRCASCSPTSARSTALARFLVPRRRQARDATTGSPTPAQVIRELQPDCLINDRLDLLDGPTAGTSARPSSSCRASGSA